MARLSVARGYQSFISSSLCGILALFWPIFQSHFLTRLSQLRWIFDDFGLFLVDLNTCRIWFVIVDWCLLLSTLVCYGRFCLLLSLNFGLLLSILVYNCQFWSINVNFGLFKNESEFMSIHSVSFWPRENRLAVLRIGKFLIFRQNAKYDINQTYR